MTMLIPQADLEGLCQRFAAPFIGSPLGEAAVSCNQQLPRPRGGGCRRRGDGASDKQEDRP
jgi:hypothetical protein